MHNAGSGYMSMLAHNARAHFTLAVQESAWWHLNEISLHYIICGGLILHPKSPTEYLQNPLLHI
jgi:hypothetical protein